MRPTTPGGSSPGGRRRGGGESSPSKRSGGNLFGGDKGDDDPVSRHITAIKPPGPGHPTPGLTIEWVCHVLSRVCVHHTLPAGHKLWSHTEPASYIVFLLSGQLVTGRGNGWYERYAEKAAEERAMELAEEAKLDPAAAIAGRAKNSSRRRSTARAANPSERPPPPPAPKKSDEPLEALIHEAGDVLGTDFLLGAKEPLRMTDCSCGFDKEATILVLPLEVLYQLGLMEPEAMLGVARLIAISTPFLPHLSAAAEEWESLARSANRTKQPITLGASQMAMLKQAQLSLTQTAHGLVSHLSELHEKGQLALDDPSNRDWAAYFYPSTAASNASNAIAAGISASPVAAMASPAYAETTMWPPALPPASEPLREDPQEDAQQEQPPSHPPQTAQISRPASRASLRQTYSVGSLPGSRPLSGFGSRPLSGHASLPKRPMPVMRTGMGTHEPSGLFVAAYEDEQKLAERMAAQRPSTPAYSDVAEELTMSKRQEYYYGGPRPSTANPSVTLAEDLRRLQGATIANRPQTSQNVRPPARPSTPNGFSGMVLSASMPALGLTSGLGSGLAVEHAASPVIRYGMETQLGGTNSASAAASEFFRRRDALASRRQAAHREEIDRINEGRASTANAAVHKPPPLESTSAIYGNDDFNLSQATQGERAKAEMRRAAQEQYYNILADTAIAVDIAMSQPGPRALVHRERDRRDDALREQREERAAALAASEERQRAAKYEKFKREAAARARPHTPMMGPSGQLRGHSSSISSIGGQRPHTAASALRGSMLDGSEGSGSRPSSPPGGDAALSVSASRASFGQPGRPGAPPPVLSKKKPPPRRSAETQAKRLALRTSAFDQMRRDTHKGLRQVLDRYSDERVDKYRRKMVSLDVKKLTEPGHKDPNREMEKMRQRAEALPADDD